MRELLEPVGDEIVPNDVLDFIRSHRSLGRVPTRGAPFPDQVLAVVVAYTRAIIWSANVDELAAAEWAASQRRLGMQAAKFAPQAGYLALITDLYVESFMPKRPHPLELLLLRCAAGLAAASTLRARPGPAAPHPLATPPHELEGAWAVDVRVGGFHHIGDLLGDPQVRDFLEQSLDSDSEGRQVLRLLLRFFAWTRGELRSDANANNENGMGTA